MPEVPHLSEPQLLAQLTTFGVAQPAIQSGINLARRVHGGQTRAGGGPYLEEHVYPITAAVAGYLSVRSPENVVPAALTALLHDAIEDSDWLDEGMIERDFGQPVARWVGLLTKPTKHYSSDLEEQQAEQRYLDAIRQAPLAVQVIKVQDRLNNLLAVHRRPNDERRNYLRESRTHYLSLAEQVDPDLAAQMARVIDLQERNGMKSTS